MLTAYQIVTAYCQQKSIQLTHEDFDKLVFVVSKAYRHRYIKKVDAPTGVPIAGSGFLIEEREGRKMVVVYYPNTPVFVAICNAAMDEFFVAKAARIEEHLRAVEAAEVARKLRQEQRKNNAPKKERKRIPLRPELREKSPEYNLPGSTDI